jgi:hypothetical protein
MTTNDVRPVVDNWVVSDSTRQVVAPVSTDVVRTENYAIGAIMSERGSAPKASDLSLEDLAAQLGFSDLL